jgi:hypothetical protein
MRKVFLTLLLCGFVSLAMAANTPTHKSPAVQKLNTLLENNVLKTPEKPPLVLSSNLESQETSSKAVEFCFYEVTVQTPEGFIFTDTFFTFCPGQGIIICFVYPGLDEVCL